MIWTFVCWGLVAFAATTAFSSVDRSPENRFNVLGLIAGSIVLALALLVAWAIAPSPEVTNVAVGLIGGFAAVTLASLNQARGGTAAQAAIGYTGAALIAMLVERQSPQLAASALVGAGIGTIALGTGLYAGVAGLSLGCTLIAGALGTLAAGGWSGPLIGLASGGAVVAALVLAALGGVALRNSPKWILTAGACVIGIAAAYGLGALWLNDMTLVWSLGLGVIAGAALVILNSESGSDVAMRAMIGALIVVASATVSFGFARGLGVSLALLGALIVPLAANDSRSLLSLAPFVALAGYRLFREAHLDAARTLELGQHYAVMGVILGCCLPLLVQEWQSSGGGTKRIIGTGLLAALLLASVPLVALVLGAKGVVGLLVGLGLSGLVESMREAKSPALIGGILLISGAGTATFGWYVRFLEMSRDEKVRAFGYAVIALLVVGAALLTLRRTPGTAEDPSGATS
jgi:hypothetical protein